MWAPVARHPAAGLPGSALPGTMRSPEQGGSQLQASHPISLQHRPAVVPSCGTHTCACTRTHTHTVTHTSFSTSCTCTYMLVHTSCTPTCTHVCMYTFTHAHLLTHLVCVGTHLHTYTHVHTDIHSCSHTPHTGPQTGEPQAKGSPRPPTGHTLLSPLSRQGGVAGPVHLGVTQTPHESSQHGVQGRLHRPAAGARGL